MRVRPHQSDLIAGAKASHCGEDPREGRMWTQEFYHSLTQVRRTVLLAVKTTIVYFAAVSVFRLHGVRRPMNAADFILKSAHFVFKAMCAGSGRDRHFLAPYTVIWPAFWERAGRNAAQSVFLSFVILSGIPGRAGTCGPGGKGNAENGMSGESLTVIWAVRFCLPRPAAA